MTKSEYLEYVQEALAFGNGGSVPVGIDQAIVHPQFQLRESEDMCRALQRAHTEYCHRVAMILFPEREHELRKEHLDQQLMWLLDDKSRRDTVAQAAEHGFCA